MASREQQEAAILRANRRFYDAFEQLDIDAMAAMVLYYHPTDPSFILPWLPGDEPSAAESASLLP